MPVFQQHLVELLDRRFQLLQEQDEQEYLAHFLRFAALMLRDAELAPYSRQLVAEFEQRLLVTQEKWQQEVCDLVELRRQTTETFPDLDNSNTAFDEGPLGVSYEYDVSLAHFDDLVSGVSRESGESFSLIAPSMYDDSTLPLQVLSILKSTLRPKFDAYAKQAAEQRARGDTVDKMPEALDRLWSRLGSIEQAHAHDYRDFVNWRRTSPGQALVNVADLAKRLNPEPLQYESIHEIWKLRSLKEEWYYGHLGRVLYANEPDPKELKAVVNGCRNNARISYEGLRESISRLGAHEQIVNRYKIRCMWYDPSEVHNLGLQSDGEVALTRHLALYLYDQGLPVVSRLRVGIHEPDVAELGQGAILIEVKKYHAQERPSRVREKLIRGLAQLHAYLNAFEAHTEIREAYYVVYRLGGPLVEMPRYVRTPRFNICTVLIDMGEAHESGSRQSRPVVITEADLTFLIEP